MINKTIIFLFEKFHYYDDVFFDKKNKYFINVQIINTFYDKQIIDYVNEFNDNRHDFHCFLKINLYKHRFFLFIVDE